MRILRAGPLSLAFDGVSGGIRRLEVAGHEIVRRVYPAVRDKDWHTLPYRVWNVDIKESDDSFSVDYLARAEAGDVDFAWRGAITGDPRGCVKVRMRGQARSDFLRNRIGLCVLHPTRSCAGLAAAVESADGGLRRGTFPRYIYPHPPFTGFKKLWYSPAPGLRLRVDFEGELFEMEDQRNWTDASFKSYSTPSSLPRPLATPKGTIIDQTVTLTLEESAPEPRPAPPAVLVIDARPTHAVPRIGLGLARRGLLLRAPELDRLRALRPAHLRADLRFSSPQWPDVLRRAVEESKATGCPLELALTFEADRKAEFLKEALKSFAAPVARVLLFQEGQPVIVPALAREAKSILAALLPGAPVGGGSDAHFESLNVAQAGRDWDLVAWPASPQVHLHDDWTLVENLEGLGATIESARLFSGGRPLCVTPITLLPRSGPGAPGGMSAAPDADERQWSLAGAAWTLGALKRLGEAGAASATFYETAGARGVMEREPKPVYPLYHALADTAEFAGGRVLPCRSTDPLGFDGAAFTAEGRTRTLLANFGDEPRRVEVTPLPPKVRLKRLNARTVELATAKPRAWRASPGEELETGGRLELELGPWEVVRIDA